MEIATNLESISGAEVAFKLERLLLDVDDLRRGWVDTLLTTLQLDTGLLPFCCCCCFWCCLKRDRLKKSPRIAFRLPSLISGSTGIPTCHGAVFLYPFIPNPFCMRGELSGGESVRSGNCSCCGGRGGVTECNPDGCHSGVILWNLCKQMLKSSI